MLKQIELVYFQGRFSHSQLDLVIKNEHLINSKLQPNRHNGNVPYGKSLYIYIYKIFKILGFRVRTTVLKYPSFLALCCTT